MNSLNQNTILPSNVMSPSNLFSSATWRFLVASIVVLGIFFRLFHYVNNRSLWVDEAYLAISLIKMNFTELATPPLEYEQKAPIGFLWLVRGMVLVFGKKEMALRLIPFLCGIASLLVFVPVARYFLKPIGVIVALGLLAFAPPLVYHAVEIKQYGSELLATIICLYLYMQYQGKMEASHLLKWGFWGALLLWFSYSAIFILAGIAIGFCLYHLFRKEWRLLFRSIIPFSFWLFSFALNFYLFTYKHADSEWLTNWFRLRGGFMPLPNNILADTKWLFQSFYRFLDYPLGILWNFGITSRITSVIKIVMALFTIGLWALGMLVFYRKDKKLFFILVFPIFLTLLASGLQLYPFYERLLVFLAPIVIIFIARGCGKLIGILPDQKPFFYAIPFLLLLWPFYTSAHQVINPHIFGGRKNAYERDALFYIKDRYQEGDVVYIYWNFRQTYLYYKDAYGLTFKNTIEGSDIRLQVNSTEAYFAKMEPEFNAIAANNRLWFIHSKFLKINIGDFDDQPAWYFAEEEEPGTMFQKKFEKMGTLKDVFQNPYVKVSLYELSKPN